MNTSSRSPYEPALSQTLDAAVARICETIQQTMPLAGSDVIAWMRQLARGEEPAAYFHHLRGSPMFLFPWYLEKHILPEPDPSLQFDLIYSTVNGYYWIRLIDNLTDRQSTNEMELLSALGFFHTEFQRPYQKYFQAEHPFWDFFASTWFHSADVTMKDLRITDLDRQQFIQIAAQKICAIKIPLAGVSYVYSRADLIPAWTSFVDLFGCWHQMSNDLFHWYEDSSLGTPTYFLAEAARQKRPEESVPDWVTREGFVWGSGVLDTWMQELQLRATELQSRDLSDYLIFRDDLLRREVEETLEALRLAANLKGLFF